MAERVPEIPVSSSTEIVALLATGASFTGFTVIDTVAVFEFKLPSLARKVKLSLPLKFAFGE